MLRTLPTKHMAELEDLLPEALSNTTLVNGLECKLNNSTSKVCFSDVFSPRAVLSVIHSCCFYTTLSMRHIKRSLLGPYLKQNGPKWFLQVSYVIETSDTFLRRKRRQQDLSFLVAQRARKFHNWYSQHEQTMIPAYASVLGI